MMSYSIDEKLEMILIYGECGRNSMLAQQLYAERFPDKRQPSRCIFERILKTVRETGSLLTRKKCYPNSKTNNANVRVVLAAISNNPHISSRQIAHECNISQSSVLRILHRHRFHPYHVSLHQALHGNDFNNRVVFCQWALQQLQTEASFFDKVPFTDESTFTNHGQVNCRNLHYWSVENPHWLRQVERQRPWSVNVWCGMIGNCIIGPYFIDGTLNGERYAEFLQNELDILFEEVPIMYRSQMWYQHDGCPAHYATVARQMLNRKFPGRWIGRGGVINWPARSPDLTPLDYFLWGTLKEKVYADVPTTPEDMRRRIVDACSDISVEAIQNANQSFIHRVRECIAARGHHFEHRQN